MLTDRIERGFYILAAISAVLILAFGASFWLG